MLTLKVDTEQIKLPDEVAKIFIGRIIQFVKIQDGFMMKTVPGSIKAARGVLKNKNFSTEKYFQFKIEDKAIET